MAETITLQSLASGFGHAGYSYEISDYLPIETTSGLIQIGDQTDEPGLEQRWLLFSGFDLTELVGWTNITAATLKVTVAAGGSGVVARARAIDGREYVDVSALTAENIYESVGVGTFYSSASGVSFLGAGVKSIALDATGLNALITGVEVPSEFFNIGVLNVNIPIEDSYVATMNGPAILEVTGDPPPSGKTLGQKASQTVLEMWRRREVFGLIATPGFLLGA